MENLDLFLIENAIVRPPTLFFCVRINVTPLDSRPVQYIVVDASPPRGSLSNAAVKMLYELIAIVSPASESPRLTKHQLTRTQVRPNNLAEVKE